MWPGAKNSIGSTWVEEANVLATALLPSVAHQIGSETARPKPTLEVRASTCCASMLALNIKKVFGLLCFFFLDSTNYTYF